MATYNDDLPEHGLESPLPTFTSNVTGQAPAPTPTNITPIGPTGGATAPAATGGGDDFMSTLLKAAPQLATMFNNYQGIGQNQDRAAQFTAQADKYGAILNPYGAYRDAAAQRLAQLQADPSSIANTPGYKFSLDQGLGAVANRDNRSFGVGAGSTNPDLMNFAQGLASKTYDSTIKQLSDQAGVGIGPQSAASIYQTGMLGNLASTAAAQAAQGNTIGSVAGAASTLLPAAVSAIRSAFGGNASGPMPASVGQALAKQGLSPAQAQQAWAQAGGTADTGAGSIAGDNGGNGDAVTGPGTGWSTDANGNTVQDSMDVTTDYPTLPSGGIDWNNVFTD